MEKLLSIEHKSKDSKSRVINEMIAALLLSLGVSVSFRDLFSLRGFLDGPGTLGGGLIKIWNQIVEALGRADYMLLNVRQGASEGSGLVVILFFVMVALAAFFLIRTEKTWTLLVFVLPVCCLDLFFKVSVSPVAFGTLAGAVLFALCCMKGNGSGFVWHLVLTGAVLILSLALTLVPGISDLTQKPAAVRSVNRAVRQWVEDLYYGENPLGSGDLTQRNRQEGSRTALEISMEQPHSMYLRGFVGETYNGKSWMPLPESTYYDARDLMYWLSRAGCEPLGQVWNAAVLADRERTEGEITVTVKDADTRFAYIPYEICGSGIERGRVWGGSFISSSKFGKLSSYSYTAGDNAVKDWTTIAARMFTSAGEGEHAGDTERYLEAESYYNTFVYENDTGLSKTDKQLISEYLGASGDQSKGHIDYKEAITKITTYLEESFIYTENLGAAATEGTVLEEFLSSGKGYDVQYATAAVLMFRYYGIPARYVEGYLVTPEDVKGVAPGETIKVSRDRAHAWVEIYIDGVGFVPVEVSPEYHGIMEQADLSVGISNNTLLRPFEDHSESGRNQVQEVSDGGDDAKHPSYVWLMTAIVVIGAVVLLFLIWIFSKLYKKIWNVVHRRRLFCKAPPKTAVSSMYGYLETLGIWVQEDIRELGNRAAYSQNPIREEERSVMLQYVREAKREWKKEKKRR